MSAADDFLELVDRHAPELEAFGEPIYYRSTRESVEHDSMALPVLGVQASEGLADAAPALAAAAIRFLRAHQRMRVVQEQAPTGDPVADAYFAALAAMREALPPELRP